MSTIRMVFNRLVIGPDGIARQKEPPSLFEKLPDPFFTAWDRLRAEADDDYFRRRLRENFDNAVRYYTSTERGRDF